MIAQWFYSEKKRFRKRPRYLDRKNSVVHYVPISNGNRVKLGNNLSPLGGNSGDNSANSTLDT